MTRALGPALLALFVAGCLTPGDPVLATRDTSPPYVQRTVPGEGALFPPDGELKLTFSEPMDDRSLLPGISLLAGGQTPVALDVLLPPPGPTPEPVEPEAPYTVRAVPSNGPLAGDTPYTLVLNTLLADRAGNPLAEEVRVTFFTLP